MLLNCNCTKLANFEDFKTCLGAFFRGHGVYTVHRVRKKAPLYFCL